MLSFLTMTVDVLMQLFCPCYRNGREGYFHLWACHKGVWSQGWSSWQWVNYVKICYYLWGEPFLTLKSSLYIYANILLHLFSFLLWKLKSISTNSQLVRAQNGYNEINMYFFFIENARWWLVRKLCNNTYTRNYMKINTITVVGAKLLTRQ
jgi:hypothetical protein